MLGDLTAQKDETEEERCLDVLLHYLPSLEKFAGCDDSVLSEKRAQIFSTINNIRSVLSSLLMDSLKIQSDNAIVVTNATAKPVIESLSQEIVPRCPSSYPNGPHGIFNEYNFTSNMLRIIQHYHGQYYQGRLLYADRDSELSALWIASSVLGELSLDFQYFALL